MKFTYVYNSADNVRHTEVVHAKSKENAYSTLKSRGIRPIRVDEAPGIFNKLFGKGKRWIAIVVLAVAFFVAIVLMLRYRSIAENVVEQSIEPTHRHQIYGDPALMDKMERTLFRDVFEDEADRLLARFSQPGTRVLFDSPDWREKSAAILASAKFPEISIKENDAREVVELKRIVLGMREEYKHYMEAGTGTPRTFVLRLAERQRREHQILATAKKDLDGVTDAVKWEEVNDQLRNLGLPTLLMPDEVVE